MSNQYTRCARAHGEKVTRCTFAFVVVVVIVVVVFVVIIIIVVVVTIIVIIITNTDRADIRPLNLPFHKCTKNVTVHSLIKLLARQSGTHCHLTYQMQQY